MKQTYHHTLGAYLAPGLVGLRRNMVPGFILQACALLIVLAYFFVPPVNSALNTLGNYKLHYGYGYSAVSTATFGGAIPFLVLWITGQVPRGRRLAEFAFYVSFWLWKGCEVDGLYRLQSLIFGSQATVGAVLGKTFVDQFIYNPLWAGPTQVLFFLWKDAGFSWSGLRARLRQESLGHRLVIVLFSTWMVWVPAVAIVYCLPTALQVPLSNLVLCFWCLLMSFLSRSSADEPAVATPSSALSRANS